MICRIRALLSWECDDPRLRDRTQSGSSLNRRNSVILSGFHSSDQRNAPHLCTLQVRRRSETVRVRTCSALPSDKISLRQRLEKVGDAWDDFQANRARDAVYGYLEAVFAVVDHYKVRRKTKKLLRHAF
jgi:hypothetical protein